MDSSIQTLGWKEYYRKINTYYYAMVFVPFLLFSVRYIQLYSSYQTNKDEVKDMVFSSSSMIVLVVSLLFILVINIFYRKKVKKVVLNKTLSEKLEKFKTVFFQYTLWVQLFALLLVLFYWIFDFPILVLVYGIILVLSSMHRPSYLRLFSVLRFSKEEKDLFLGNTDDK